MQPAENRVRPVHPRRIAVFATAILSLCQCAAVQAQAALGSRQVSGSQNESGSSQESASGLTSRKAAESNFKPGPPSRARDRSARRFRICWRRAGKSPMNTRRISTSHFAMWRRASSSPAIDVLNELRSSGHDTVDVENLLAQALHRKRRRRRKRWLLCRKPRPCRRRTRSSMCLLPTPARTIEIMRSGSKS